jgi:hypothetical protein
MMKKNYFGMIMTAIVMMFAGWSLTSCSEKDVSIVNGEVYEKPEVQLTDDGAIVKGSSPADISRMMSRIKTEISDAAKAGQAFKISVDAAINSTSSDNEISIPTPPDADIELSFTNPIKTEVPLTLKTKGAGDDATALASTNKVEINIPSGSSEADLELIFPTSTVTLKGGAIDELTAITATNTLIIESGVTIEWLKMKDGRALVKDGGKVLGYMRDGSETKNGTDALIDSAGVQPVYVMYGPDVYFIKDEVEEPYYTEKLKIIKGDAKVARVEVHNGKANSQFESILIEDGAAASFGFYDDTEYDPDLGYWVTSKECKGVKLIEGLGNKTAKIYGQLSSSMVNNKMEYRSNINLYRVNEIKNVTIDGTFIPNAYGPDENWNWKDLGDLTTSISEIGLGANSTDCDIISAHYIYGNIFNDVMSKVTNCNLTCPLEDIQRWGGTTSCYISTINANNSKLTAQNMWSIDGNCESSTFKCKNIEFENYYNSGSSATVNNCKFESIDKEDAARIYLPYQTEKRSSFDFIFNTCSFGKGFKFSTSFAGNKPWLDKDGKKVTKGYFWYELEEDGTTIKRDEHGSYIEKQSADEKDIPEANKKNGEIWYGNGYWVRENSNGLSIRTYYKDYTANIKFNSTTLDGKTITNKTEFISSVDTGYDEKGEAATTTYFELDGKTYEAMYNANTGKWQLVAVED